MILKRLALSVLACTLTAACGQVAELKPAGDASLPPEPYGANARPEAADLLEPDTLAQPERTIELRTRSEEREDDPFDLPPE